MSIARILLVEDDPNDVMLTKRALKSSKLHVAMDHVSNGKEALAYLNNEGQYASAEKPDLILLDLNMPGISGLEVLKAIKKEESLCGIPVVVLTTSDADKDVIESYASGANCYIRKPVDMEEFQKIVISLESFWFTVVRLPES